MWCFVCGLVDGCLVGFVVVGFLFWVVVCWLSLFVLMGLVLVLLCVGICLVSVWLEFIVGWVGGGLVVICLLFG